MGNEHRQRMMDEMQREFFNSDHRMKSGFLPGTWSGTEQFYDLSEHLDIHNESKQVGDPIYQQRCRSDSFGCEKEQEQINKQSS